MGARNVRQRIKHVRRCERSGLLYYSVARFRAGLCAAKHGVQATVIPDEGGQLIGSCVSVGKRCPVSGIRQGAMALFNWCNILTTSQFHQRGPVALLERTPTNQKPTTPSTLALLICGRLFGELGPT